MTEEKSLQILVLVQEYGDIVTELCVARINGSFNEKKASRKLEKKLNKIAKVLHEGEKK
jgi:hypothetical protein